MYTFEDVLNLVRNKYPNDFPSIQEKMAEYIIKTMSQEDESAERILNREWPTNWLEKS